MSAKPRMQRLAEIRFREPTSEDGAALHQLVANCPPLDLNSLYVYLLVGEHFADTSVVAERDGRPIGMISGYLPPERRDSLFVWQVAVAEEARGLGLAKRMLASLLARPTTAHCRWIETTVTPSNDASERLFRGFARDLGTDCRVQELFSAEDFGGAGHEPERLFRIGPFQNHTDRSKRNEHFQHRHLQPTRVENPQLLPKLSRHLPPSPRRNAD